MKRIKILPVWIALACLCISSFAQKQKVWIDADTGNETDDIYALIRLLEAPEIDVIGVSSAHFNNADLVAFEKWNQYNTRNIHTVHISQQLNKEILQLTGKFTIPHPLGADRQMGRSWGGRQPMDSPAARQLIAAVKRLGRNEQLAVICLGALTNIASAISLDTAIANRLVCYALGAKYNIDKGYWNKSEFNIRNDLNAFDYLLDNPLVDIIIMPVDIALPFQFNRDSLFAQLNNRVPIHHMLRRRWEETNPESTVRTLWDLALAEAFIHPSLAVIKPVLTPPENTQRMIKIYTQISAQQMKNDFFNVLQGMAH